MRLEAADDRRRRYVDQGDSSDEAELKKTMFCSGCGSYRCQRTASHCREANKLDRLSRLLETFAPDKKDENAKIHEAAVSFLADLLRYVAEMAKRAAERESQKKDIRRLIEERRRGRADEITSGSFWAHLAECIEKERADPGSCIL